MKQILLTLAMALLLIGATLTTPANAQRITDNAVFYHSIRSPWSNAYNPALFPRSSGWYVTTAKTSMQLSMPLSYDELGLTVDEERGVTILNVNDLLTKLRTTGCNFYNNNDINLLGFGFTSNEQFHFTASAGMKTLTSFNVPLGFIDFITQGNLNESRHVEFGAKDIFSNQIFAYASLGLAFKLPAIPLTLGGRINILDGVSALSIDNLSINLHTEEDVSVMRLTSDYLMHTAGAAQFKKNNNGGYDFSFKTLKEMVPLNIGYTFDLGAKFEISIWDFSLSIVDLGPGIRWRQNPTAIVPKQKDISISFSGIDLSSIMNQGVIDTSFIGRLKDSLLAMIDYTEEESGYWYSIPTRMYAGVSASVGEFLRLGYLFQGQWYNGWINNHRSDTNHFACNHTLSAHLNLFNWLELSLVNSFTFDGQHFTLLNPGCALTLSPGKRTQLFAAIEYLSNMNPEKINAAHFMFGINVVGLKKLEKQQLPKIQSVL